jgi:hypothetical protein
MQESYQMNEYTGKLEQAKQYLKDRGIDAPKVHIGLAVTTKPNQYHNTPSFQYALQRELLRR